MEIAETNELRYFKEVFTYFNSQEPNPENQCLSSTRMVEIMKASKLPNELLAKVYTLMNFQPSQSIKFTEFTLAMQYMTMAKNGVEPKREKLGETRKMDYLLLKDCPVFPRPIIVNPETGNTRKFQETQLLEITPEFVKNALKTMETIQKKGPPFTVSFGTAKTFFASFGLPSSVLVIIWNLSDTKKKASLSEEEAILSLYLIDLFKSGVQLPEVLPNSLATFVNNYHKPTNSRKDSSFNDEEKSQQNEGKTIGFSDLREVNVIRSQIVGSADKIKDLKLGRSGFELTPEKQNLPEFGSQRNVVLLQRMPEAFGGVKGSETVDKRTVEEETEKNAKNGFNIFSDYSFQEPPPSNFGFGNIELELGSSPLIASTQKHEGSPNNKFFSGSKTEAKEMTLPNSDVKIAEKEFPNKFAGKIGSRSNGVFEVSKIDQVHLVQQTGTYKNNKYDAKSSDVQNILELVKQMEALPKQLTANSEHFSLHFEELLTENSRHFIELNTVYSTIRNSLGKNKELLKKIQEIQEQLTLEIGSGKKWQEIEVKSAGQIKEQLETSEETYRKFQQQSVFAIQKIQDLKKQFEEKLKEAKIKQEILAQNVRLAILKKGNEEDVIQDNIIVACKNCQKIEIVEVLEKNEHEIQKVDPLQMPVEEEQNESKFADFNEVLTGEIAESKETKTKFEDNFNF